MKAFLVALGFVLIAVTAFAQTADKLDVYEYGTYASSPRVAFTTVLANVSPS